MIPCCATLTTNTASPLASSRFTPTKSECVQGDRKRGRFMGFHAKPLAEPSVRADTVDKFQGGERPVVFVSTWSPHLKSKKRGKKKSSKQRLPDTATIQRRCQNEVVSKTAAFQQPGHRLCALPSESTSPSLEHKTSSSSWAKSVYARASQGCSNRTRRWHRR